MKEVVGDSNEKIFHLENSQNAETALEVYGVNSVI